MKSSKTYCNIFALLSSNTTPFLNSSRVALKCCGFQALCLEYDIELSRILRPKWNFPAWVRAWALLYCEASEIQKLVHCRQEGHTGGTFYNRNSGRIKPVWRVLGLAVEVLRVLVEMILMIETVILMV